MKTKRTAQSAFLTLCVVIGLAVFFAGLFLALLATANPQTPLRVRTRNLDAQVYAAAPVATPTATPCASVGSWTEQAPYPISISGAAGAAQGGSSTHSGASPQALPPQPLTSTRPRPIPGPRLLHCPPLATGSARSVMAPM